jgi:hypothetical protein
MYALNSEGELRDVEEEERDELSRNGEGSFRLRPKPV